MPQYVYRCPDHGEFEVYFDFGEQPSEVECGRAVHSGPGSLCSMECASTGFMDCRCDHPAKRIFSFTMATVMQEHFDVSTGKVVSDPRQLKNEFRRASEEATERTGIPHNFQPVDMSDKAALGVTDEGLKATHDAKVKRGVIEPTKKVM